jgi:adenosylhomocysteine nucleosidase
MAAAAIKVYRGWTGEWITLIMRNIYANLAFCIKYMQERIGCMPIGELKRPGIVVGMAAEARIARRSGYQVATLSGASALLTEGADGLISFGIAGGLAPGLPPGTVVVATEVIAEDGRQYPALETATGLMQGAVRAPIAGAAAIVARAEAKQTLYRRTGAVAVDLESADVARLCADAGVPLAVIRAIADPAERDLPPAALIGLGPDGKVDLGAVLGSVLRQPRQIPALLAVALDTRRALAALDRVCSRGLL